MMISKRILNVSLDYIISLLRSLTSFLLNRYGLPVNFAAIVIHPTRKTSKRLRDVLDRLFGYLDQSDRSYHD